MNAPALAGDLGRLAAPMPPAWDDSVRLGLVDDILAAKQAGHLDHAEWLQAFTRAAQSLRDEILRAARMALQAAAVHSRYPARRLHAVLPDAEQSEALLNRLLAEAIPLERLESAPDDAMGRRARAAALEAAWEGASRIATLELHRWRGVAAQMAEWRRPLRPLWIVAAVSLAAALLIASWLGGVIAAPEWFRPMNDAWWSLPWP